MEIRQKQLYTQNFEDFLGRASECKSASILWKESEESEPDESSEPTEKALNQYTVTECNALDVTAYLWFQNECMELSSLSLQNCGTLNSSDYVWGSATAGTAGGGDTCLHVKSLSEAQCQGSYIWNESKCVARTGASSSVPSKSCKLILDNEFASTDGVYWLDPNGGDSSDSFQAYCEMTTDGGGWTLIVAQYEGDPVVNWNEGIQGDYDPTLSTGKSFVFSTTELPSHSQISFGKDLDPTYITYVSFIYTTGDISEFGLQGLKSGATSLYDLHRNSAGYYGYHNPENTLNVTESTWNNTLTIDAQGGNSRSWAFSPLVSSSFARGCNMLGYACGSNESYAWTVWVR